MKTLCSYEACGEDRSDSSFHETKARTEEFNRLSGKHCIYCTSQLSRDTFEKYLPPVQHIEPTPESIRGGHFRQDFASLELKHCRCCGWWLLDYDLSYTIHYPAKGIPVHLSKLLFGEVKHYDLVCIEAPLAEIYSYFSHQPDHPALFHPKKFERLIQDCFSAFFGAAEVIHAGQSEEGSTGLKMILTDEETYLMHVKQKSSGNSKIASAGVVKKLNGVLFREDHARGLVVTNAHDTGAVSRQNSEIRSGQSETYEMQLLTFDDILKMLQINTPSPYQPWMTYIDDIDFSTSDRFLKSAYIGRKEE